MTTTLGKLNLATIRHDEALLELVAAITDLSLAKVAKRTLHHGRTLVRNEFMAEWPEEPQRLARLTVDQARAAGLVDEIAGASEISSRRVRALLRDGSPRTLLGDLFPTLVDAEEADSVDGDLSGRPFGVEDDEEAELVGQLRIALVRKSSPVLVWIAAQLRWSERRLREKLDLVDGKTLVRNALPEWPPRTIGSAAANLGQVRAARVVAARPLAAWVSLYLDIPVARVQALARRVDGNVMLRSVLPSLAAAGEPRQRRGRGDAGSDVVGPELSDPSRRKVAPGDQQGLAPGVRVAGRWELRRLLGVGGFGAAWEAADARHGVGIRVLKFTKDPKQVEHLQRELGTALALRHPNVCAYYDMGDDPAFGTFLVLEHGGEALRSRIERGPLAVELTRHVLREVATALDYAHRLRPPVIHFDISPGNILLEQSVGDVPHVRVADFGIAKVGRITRRLDGGTTAVASTMLGYNPGYVAPEQFHDPRSASDQYALARVVCSMLEGRVYGGPREGRRAFDLLSGAANAALARALAMDAEARFPSCGSFADAFGAS